MRTIFTAEGFYAKEGLAALRVLVGLLMAYHGLEIFNATVMSEYAKWEVIKTLPFSSGIAYVGKGIELVSGICLAIGAFTRIAALTMAINMLFICFWIGNGRFYYEDQHPFLFALIALVFFFSGPVKWAVDFRLFKHKSA
ncbi:MAG TPA: DoxX family protein [Cyclobacteriaceae bacterium]|jgi:putative oxidoreductase|nr:DoxX family protein [Cyclobacteriaceae bacterium]